MYRKYYGLFYYIRQIDSTLPCVCSNLLIEPNSNDPNPSYLPLKNYTVCY